MSYRSRALHLTPRQLAITASCALVLVALVLALVAGLGSAPASTAGTKPTLQVSAGFDGRYKNETWIPVHVALSNTGADFTGTLSINPSSALAPLSASTLYQSSITLPTDAQKQITLYIPFNSAGEYQSLTIRLLDTRGRLLQAQSALLHALGADDIFIGLLSDQPDDFGTLNSVDLPNRNATIVTAALNARNFPTTAAALDNFAMLVLDDFTTSSLNNDQLVALQAWIERGGVLVEVGGLSWLRTLEPLPADLLPVNVTATSVLPDGISLLPLSGPSSKKDQLSETLATPIPISAAEPTATPADTISTTLLSSGTTPLLVQRQQGHGLLYYVAFDPTLEPLAGWRGTPLLWQNLLLRSLGEQALPANSGEPVLPASGTANGTLTPDIPLISISMQNLLLALLPHTLPLPWPLIGLLIGYLLVLGPLRALVLQRLGRRWSWHIVLSTFVVFSGIAYGLALHEKHTTIASASISILQFNQDGAPAHITTYAGVFLPDQGSFQVSIPGADLTHILPQAVATGTPLPQQTAISGGPHGSLIALNGQNSWMMHTLIAEQDRQLSGNVASHLTLAHGILNGTLTNTLPYSLSDTYILTNEGYIPFGPLRAGQTRAIDSTFRRMDDSNATLADQIAADNGLATPYDPGIEPQKAGTLQQQHIAMLTALSGELSQFTCGLNVCSLKNSALPQQKPFADPVLLSTPSYDPLLAANTAATLIGWASQQPDTTNTIAVNGALTDGVHQVFVQVPLAIHATNTLDIPPDTLSAQLAAVQGDNVQMQPGLYLMNTGSVTFDLALPPGIDVQQHAVTASLMPYPPDGIYLLGAAGIRTVADIQRLHLSLYNWQTHTWDNTPLRLYTFTVQQRAYIGPGQHILFKVENQNALLGTFIFGTPIVQL